MKITLTQKQLISLSRDCGLHVNPYTSKKQFTQLFKQHIEHQNKPLTQFSMTERWVNFYNKVIQTQRENQLSKLFK